jgi:signal transduction histidine kinase
LLNLTTLIFLYILTNLLNTGALTIIWNQNRRRFEGTLFWVAAMSLQVTGSFLLILRGRIPDIISITLANAAILAGLPVLLVGLERFAGKRGPQAHNFVLLAVFTVVSAYFAVVRPNLLARDIAVSVTLMIYTLQCCWLLLRRVDPALRPITRLTGIIFALYAALNIVRIPLSILFPGNSADFLHSGTVNALTIISAILLNLSVTFSAVLMINERLLAGIQTYTAELEAKRKLLESEISKRIEFSNALVHELKTPLTPISASSELLMDELREEPWHSIAKNINDGANSLSRRINELLELSRIEVGTLSIDVSSMDVKQLLEDTIEYMKPLALEKSQTLAADLPADLPRILADPERIKQIVLNLLSNAISYSQPGAATVVRARQRETDIVIEVQDHGRGMSDEVLKHIFEPYYRAAGTKGNLSGMGLGLSIAKNLVELHGGQIRVESEPGRGSTFEISIPIKKSPAA